MNPVQLATVIVTFVLLGLLIVFLVLLIVRTVIGIRRDLMTAKQHQEIAELLQIAKQHGTITESQQREVTGVLNLLRDILARIHAKTADVEQAAKDIKQAVAPAPPSEFELRKPPEGCP